MRGNPSPMAGEPLKTEKMRGNPSPMAGEGRATRFKTEKMRANNPSPMTGEGRAPRTPEKDSGWNPTSFCINDNVKFHGRRATVVYIGKVHFCDEVCLGLIMRDSLGYHGAHGKASDCHDGSVDGVRYFFCPDAKGVFVLPRGNNVILERRPRGRFRTDFLLEDTVLFKGKIGVVVFYDAVGFDAGVWLGVRMRDTEDASDDGMPYFEGRGCFVNPATTPVYLLFPSPANIQIDLDVRRRRMKRLDPDIVYQERRSRGARPRSPGSRLFLSSSLMDSLDDPTAAELQRSTVLHKDLWVPCSPSKTRHESFIARKCRTPEAQPSYFDVFDVKPPKELASMQRQHNLRFMKRKQAELKRERDAYLQVALGDEFVPEPTLLSDPGSSSDQSRDPEEYHRIAQTRVGALTFSDLEESFPTSMPRISYGGK